MYLTILQYEKILRAQKNVLLIKEQQEINTIKI